MGKNVMREIAMKVEVRAYEEKDLPVMQSLLKAEDYISVKSW